MFTKQKKQKKIKLYELIEKLRALDKFGIDIYEAEITLTRGGCILITDKGSKTSAYIYVNNELFESSVHIYTHE